MSQDKFKNEEKIRRFLLGELTADERAAFEERFIASEPDLFDEIRVVEDELIESYVRGTFSETEKANFERNFLTTDARRRRVAFTRSMLDKLSVEKAPAVKKTETAAENTSLWNSIVNFFKTPRLAFAVFAVLVFVFGLWFLIFRNTEKRGEIVREITPTPTLSPTPEEVNQNQAVETNVNTANKSEANKTASNALNADNKTQPKEIAPKPVIATITLFAGTLRSEGKTGELNLTKETKGANFELNLEAQNYQTYRAEIVDADGNVLYRSGRLAARGKRVQVFFSTAKLKRGDYFVRLYGFNPAGEEESAADFQFRVNQK